METKFSGTMICVKDINKARAFYSELFGLKVIADYGINIGFDCGLGLQQDFHLISAVKPEEIHFKANNFELYFETDDIDGFCNRLEKFDIVYIEPLHEMPWGQKTLRFYDADGVLIEVGEPMEATVARCLKQGMTIEATAVKTQQDLQYVIGIEKKLK